MRWNKTAIAAVTAFVLCSCGDTGPVQNDRYRVVIIDSCEYIDLSGGGYAPPVHKANCKNHKQEVMP